ncbi:MULTISPECIES: GNAT family N-acetyltransferase [Legionella]|uniref:N-acetyltransferase n=1 Tax=Legionella septentrionalis TaxID=2498109 RepID=A0A433JH42_9GAMM|nr:MULTISPECIES: GNAT family N-acetyltransferase [Legionella]MCP0914024.1 GNAT family N-acetyltransferase [Legionella sp. 27cVA30]RUQ81499.1 N-acetyltransferase [Legionella septentrionalis]RUQ94597.1 N-acetyltransferase [Legionella septentrionalis]RUR08664.1 N-acetyltransferase [Legionella septentrionalis]RUR13042.1 N-acetyltransferase [Legionella septentrionalis]
MQKFIIKTENLGLRFVSKEDLPHLQELEEDPEVKTFFPSGPLNGDEVYDLIKDCVTDCKYKNLPCFAIFELQSNDFIGRAYFGELPSGETKVGYLFHKTYWGKGYATEVLGALLKWAQKHIDAEYIVAYADKNHSASFRVMEKCGMEYYKDGFYKDMESSFYRIKNK